jgi:GNAT superfamily N-acetyltransferase
MLARMSIRELLVSDLDPLLALYAELHPDDEPLPARARVEAIYSGMLRDPSQIHLGAFSEGTLASACSATVIPSLTRGARPYALIENVVTGARFRRRGLASAVMRRLIDMCWERDCYKVMLMSALRRTEIHGFYDALGFERSKQAFVMARPRPE